MRTRAPRLELVAWLGVGLALGGCSREGEQTEAPAASASTGVAAPLATGTGLPQLLYLPDASPTPPPAAPGAGLLPGHPGVAPTTGRCPQDMVDVEGRFCIDRYEATLVDVARGRGISPYYPPSRKLAARNEERWRSRRHRVGNALARAMPIPKLPAWQKIEDFEPLAQARGGVVPNGYVTGKLAKRACANAGKRLCREEEWRLACGGEQQRKYPYGDEYERSRCNVFRESHPAMVLHDNPSIEHSDPRLNRVELKGKPLLRRTGSTPSCKSVWGKDAIYDMVGNLDEWIDDDDGVFVGGFYSRSTKSGCEARVSAHGSTYYDYSLGVRCCR